MAGKLGRITPEPQKLARSIKFAEIYTGVLPAIPPTVNYGGLFYNWNMLGNDRYGDCVSVSLANQRALVSTALSDRLEYPTLDQVIAFYKTQNPKFPSQDDGMVIQYALEEAVKNGGPGGTKAVAFAQVDYTDPAELKAAHAIFGQVLYGVDVQSVNMDQFDSGQPWDYSRNSPIEGGHAITGVGYDASYYNFITWAEETKWTENFRQHLVGEAWVVIWPEHFGTRQFQAGVDVNALADAYHTLTGRILDVPVPTPVPVPDPVPTPTPVSDPTSDKLAAVGSSWEIGIISKITKAGKMKTAFDEWKRAHGYK